MMIDANPLQASLAKVQDPRARLADIAVETSRESREAGWYDEVRKGIASSLGASYEPQ